MDKELEIMTVDGVDYAILKEVKTTIKTLRYYEKENLLKPVYIDLNTGYRYYETK